MITSLTFLLKLLEEILKSGNQNFSESPEGQLKLVFEENFDSLDMSRWKPDITAGGGGNWEFQYYTNNRTNLFTKEGILYIYPTLTKEKFENFDKEGFELNLEGTEPANSCTGYAFYGCKRNTFLSQRVLANPIQSSLVRSINSFSMKYGRIDIRARLPKGDWLWPAIWMLPKNQQYGNWPASGEIDILESRGNEFKGNDNLKVMKNSRRYVSSTLHWGLSPEFNRYQKTTNDFDLQSLQNNIPKKKAQGEFTQNESNEFHTYSLRWTSEKIETYVDDNLILKVDFNKYKNGFFDFGGFPRSMTNPWTSSSNRKAAPFDQEFYLVINLAVGGVSDFFPDDLPNKPWKMKDSDSSLKFWENRDKWLPTWENNLSRAFAVDYVKAWEYSD